MAPSLFGTCLFPTESVAVCLFVVLDSVVTKEIHADCIVRSTCSLISDTYASAEGIAMHDGTIRAHELHALVLSCHGFSCFSSITELRVHSFPCSSHNFGAIYLRDFSADRFDLCVAGSLAVGQVVVRAPTQAINAG